MAESSPLKTAKVTVEYKHEDGSTTLLETNELDASGISRFNRSEDPYHAIIKMVDPYEDPDAWSRNIFVDRRSLLPREPEFFQLDLQLPVTSAGMKEKHWIYQTKHTEKPTNRMFFKVHNRMAYGVVGGELSLINQTGTEEEVAVLAERFPGAIYFMAEVPA